MRNVTPEEACAHPNWVMGRKISVDSATMMNKALEVIEARFLFGLAPERLEVVIHPQSVIHSMVQYRDASVVAQLGTPDMRVPIAYGLAWPDRVASGAQALDFRTLADMSFESLDSRRHRERFPGLAAGLGQPAGAAGNHGDPQRRQRGRRRRPSWTGASVSTRSTRSTLQLWRPWRRPTPIAGRAARAGRAVAGSRRPRHRPPGHLNSTNGLHRMLTLVAFVVALGLLIAVHEYGHYRVAVACGVKVLRFSIGFGKTLYRWQPKRQKKDQATEFVIGGVSAGRLRQDAGRARRAGGSRTSAISRSIPSP